MKTFSRRDFLATSAAVSGLCIVPRYVLGGPGFTPPSDKLNIAGIGVGGVGFNYLDNVKSENIIALCDVDREMPQKAFQAWPQASRYQDFREMLDVEKEIDAVVIGTPDHTHAIAALAALKKGYHVYCAKPLARTIAEIRRITEASRQAKVATQMSTQQNASPDHRLICEWIWDGAIGEVHHVDIWSNRPIWPQGLERPLDIPSVPPHLDWSLWIGPAPFRPYHPVYHPFKWRGWYDFGTGALGDMGCHGFDPIFKALKLGHPTCVEASSTPLFPETFPAASIVHYEFPARQNMPPVTVTWYDGGLRPKRPPELESGRDMGDKNSSGCLYHGSKGVLMTGFSGSSPRLIPEDKMKRYRRPPETLPRSIGHYQEWIEACKGGAPAGCHFDYAGPLTEVVMLGNIALRTGKKLYWDPLNVKITNDAEANGSIDEAYHNGWQLETF